MRNISHVVRVVTESSVVKNALAALVMVSMRMLEHSIILCPDKNTRSWCSRHQGQAGKDTAVAAGSCSKCVNIRVRSGYSTRCWLLGCTLISGSGQDTALEAGSAIVCDWPPWIIGIMTTRNPPTLSNGNTCVNISRSGSLVGYVSKNRF